MLHSRFPPGPWFPRVSTAHHVTAFSDMCMLRFPRLNARGFDKSQSFTTITTHFTQLLACIHLSASINQMSNIVDPPDNSLLPLGEEQSLPEHPENPEETPVSETQQVAVTSMRDVLPFSTY